MLEDKALSELLQLFYKNGIQKDGGLYGVSTLRNIRSSINRHLKRYRDIDITHEKPFTQANKEYVRTLKKARASRFDVAPRKVPISNEDWALLHSSPVLSQDNPRGLQDRVFLHLVSHFGCKSQIGVRDWTKKTFEIMNDENGLEYVQGTKECKLVNKEDQFDLPIMAAQPGDFNCPVKCFKKYLSKLDPDCDILFTP